MAKAGMKRPDPESFKDKSKRQNQVKNEVEPVPELSGHVKTGKKKAK